MMTVLNRKHGYVKPEYPLSRIWLKEASDMRHGDEERSPFRFQSIGIVSSAQHQAFGTLVRF